MEIGEIYSIFHIFTPKHDITKKKQIKQKVANLDLKIDANKDYELKSMKNNAMYTRKAQGQLPDLYYLILCNNYLKEKDKYIETHLNSITSLKNYLYF